MKPFISDTTILAIDTTAKSHLALSAIERSLEQCSFPSVKLLTDNMALKYAVKIPKLNGLESYSKFCIRELTKYVDTKYCLLCQWDGFVLNGQAWTEDFKQWDFIGSPLNPSGVIGNGGFSYRSKKLLDACATLKTEDNEHPEDSWIFHRHRNELERLGIKFCPLELARRFGFEGRSWTGKEWSGIPNQWNGSFGFHSCLSVIPPEKKPFKVAHHSGDAGDLCYALATLKALGGGVLFVSPDNRYPWPIDTRWTRTGGEPAFVDNLVSLFEAQDYVVRCQYTQKTPLSTDWDLNAFRKGWKPNAQGQWSASAFDSILNLHQRAFKTNWDEAQPWLSVTNPITLPGKPIVVNRTPRYHSDSAEWYPLVQKYGDRMIFVGTETEASVFEGFAPPKPPVKWYPTKDALEMARVIAGAKVFIGNQSFALSIAHGLGKRVICEVWKQNPNCCLKRGDDAIYWNDGEVQIPESWL